MPFPTRTTLLLYCFSALLIAGSSGCWFPPAQPASPLAEQLGVSTTTPLALDATAATTELAASAESMPVPQSAAKVDAGAVSADAMAASPESAVLAIAPVTAYAAMAPAQNTTVYAPVTAGVTDDNLAWPDYLAYRSRHQGLWVKERDVSERYLIRVVDQHALPVHDAEVTIYGNEQLLFTGRTDAGGELLFHPRALDPTYWQQATQYRVKATKGWVAQSQPFARTGPQIDSAQWTLALPDPPRSAQAQLDLLFLVDATGSMGDEIDKLKASMADIANQLDRLPEQPDIRYGLVAYRDRGDAFVVQPYDFTDDLRQFQQTLAALHADAGGDYPESLNAALHHAIHNLTWRTNETVRMILLVADAPPHLDYTDEPFRYDTDMIEAVRRGIKLFPVGASGLTADGEYIFRQLAQFTGGKFVFLTYADGSNPASGPGTETEHDVATYSVDTLDRLVVRLVREELAKLVRVMTGAQSPSAPQPWPQPSPLPTPTPPVPAQPRSCTVDLITASSDCDQIGAVQLLNWGNNQPLYQITLDPTTTGYVRARFDITYGSAPNGYTVNIGDSIGNGGVGGDSGQQSNDAEVQLVGGDLLLYGNDDTPSGETQDGHRLLLQRNDAARTGETLSLEVANGRLGISAAGGIEVFASPYLYAWTGQPDREGMVDYTLYAAFNRTINGTNGGIGVTRVVITLYPSQ